MGGGGVRQMAGQARIQHQTGLLPEYAEPALLVEGQGARRILRAGMQPDAPDAVPPGFGQRLIHHPAAKALAITLGDQSEKRNLAFIRFAKIQFDKTDGLVAIPDNQDFDRRVV